MAREVESGLGVAVGAIGFTLLIGLPPPWWADMSPYLVHAGLILGAILFVLGVSVSVIGSCRYAAENRVRARMITWWERMWTRPRIFIAAAAAVALVLLLPLAIPLHAQSSTPPSSTGDCNVNGPNYGPFSPNCHNTYLGPPRRKDGLYQNGQLIGVAQGYRLSDDHKQVILTNAHISGSGIDLKANLEMQMFSISCPTMASANDPNSTLSASFLGDTACDIVGKAN
jgi:hypothetical protein